MTSARADECSVAPCLSPGKKDWHVRHFSRQILRSLVKALVSAKEFRPRLGYLPWPRLDPGMLRNSKMILQERAELAVSGDSSSNADE